MIAERRCLGTSADGTPCGTPPQMVGSSGYCFRCDPSKQEEREKARKKGGAKTAAKFKQGLTEAELGPLKSPADAQRWLTLVAVAVAEGRLSASQGNTIKQAVTEWGRLEDLRIRSTELRAWHEAQRRKGASNG